MRKRLISEHDQVAAVISQYRSGARVPNLELLKALTLIVRNHGVEPGNSTNHHDRDLVGVPLGVLYAIGEALRERRRQARDHNVQRSAASQAKRKEILEIANKIRHSHPTLKIPEVARQARRQFLQRHRRKRSPALRVIVRDLKG